MRRDTNTDELQHHGILGMKWGVRRYQNKDGTLTPAGKRKAAKMKEEYTNLTGKRLIRKPTKKSSTSQNGEDPNKKKSIRDMSDEEITNRINRLQKEKQLVGLESDRAGAGQKFVSAVGKQVLAPAAIEAGKQVLTKWLTKVGGEALDLNDKNTKSALDALKEEATKSRLKKQIEQDKDWFKDRENESNKPKSDGKTDSKPKTDDTPKTESTKTNTSNDSNSSGSKTETWKGEWNFDTKSSSSSSNNSSKNKIIIDAEITEVAKSPTTQTGKQYLLGNNQLLLDYKEKD